MLFESMFGKNIVARIGGLVNVSREMAAIDEGNCFIGMANPSTVATGGTVEIVARVPQGYELHIRDVVINCAQPWAVTLQILSGTYTLGTTSGGLCLNQASHKKTSHTTFAFTYTGTPTVTTIYGRGYGSVSTLDFNLFTGENEKLVLPAGDYLITLTNMGTGAAAYPYVKSKFLEEEV